MRFWPRADGIQEFSSSSKARCRAFREVVASADAAGSEGAEPSRVLEASHDRLLIESEVPEMFVGADRVVFASGQLGTRRPGRRRGGKNASALDTGARIQGNLSSGSTGFDHPEADDRSKRAGSGQAEDRGELI